MLSRTVESMLANGNPQWNESYPAVTLEADMQKGGLYVIENDDGVCGMIVINEDFPSEYDAVPWARGGKCLIVHRLAIDPLHQGKKLASKLMDFAENEARRLDYDSIRLDTFVGNPGAVALYEGRGYRKAGTVSFRNLDFFCFEKQALPIEAAREIEEHVVRANDQEWLASWHSPVSEPAGTRHGSAGICLTASGEVIVVSSDGSNWELPAGRPEGAETWEETLRREVREEACATVQEAILLGYTQGRCTRGPESGLILVRSIWFARVTLDSWEPQFETRHRKLVAIAKLLENLSIADGYAPIYERALSEARQAAESTK